MLPAASELEELESLPALLDAVPSADAVALTVTGTAGALSPLEPSREALPQKILVDLSARRKKSRRRWAAFVGAVAAACLALGFLAGPLLNQPPKPDASYSVQSETGLQLTVGMVKKTWGTELEVEGKSMPLEGTLYLWVKGRDGRKNAPAAGRRPRVVASRSLALPRAAWRHRRCGAPG